MCVCVRVCVCVCVLVAQSCPTLCDCVDCAGQDPLFTGFSRQENWSGQPVPFPGGLPDSGIEIALPLCRQILYHLSYQGSPQLTPWGALTGILSTNSCGPTNTARDPTLRQRISRVEPPSYTSVFYAWEAATSYGSGYQGEKGEVHQLKELAKFLFKWEISSGFQYLRKTLSFV